MSTSRHPVALRLERIVGGDAKLLATVMGLPLVDGIFPALVLAGALDDPVGILEVGLLVFGGSATVAVVLAEMDGTPRQQVGVVLLVGSVLTTGALVEAALAPTIRSVLNMAVFERFAAVVVLAVAAKTASARVGEYLPRPAVVVGLGLLASLDPGGATVAAVADPVLVAKAGGAALVGTAFAAAVAATAPRLRRTVDVDRFRFGSAVALGLLAVSIVGPGFGGAPLAVVVVSGVFALDPGASDTDEVPTGRKDPTNGAPAGRATDSHSSAVTDGGTDASPTPRVPGSTAVEGVDGNHGDVSEGSTPPAATGERSIHSGESGSDDRAPWL